ACASIALLVFSPAMVHATRKTSVSLELHAGSEDSKDSLAEGPCIRGIFLGCQPYQLCDYAEGVCGLKKDDDLTKGLADAEERLLRRATAYNDTLYASDLVKFIAALTDFNVYTRAVLEPGERPNFLKKMGDSSSSLVKSAKLITDAMHRQGFKMVDFGALATFLEEQSKQDKPFNISESAGRLSKMFPGMSDDMRAQLVNKTTAALEEVEQCRDDPLSAACNRELLTQYGLRFLAGAEEVRDRIEDEEDKPTGSSALEKEGAGGCTGCLFGLLSAPVILSLCMLFLAPLIVAFIAIVMIVEGAGIMFLMAIFPPGIIMMMLATAISIFLNTVGAIAVEYQNWAYAAPTKGTPMGILPSF
ncbi:unnamed protein product, partial [Symbiodinium pilosum]